MDRRTFLASSGATGVVVTTQAGSALAQCMDGDTAIAGSPANANASAPSVSASKEVTLDGYLSPGACSSGHYGIFSSTPFAHDPCVTEISSWPPGVIKVYMQSGEELPAFGRVRLIGQLYHGHFYDEPTGFSTAAVMIAHAV